MATKKATKEAEVKTAEATEEIATEAAEAKPRGKASGKKANGKAKAAPKAKAAKAKAAVLPKLDNASFTQGQLDFEKIEQHPDFHNCRPPGTSTEELEEGIAELGLENPLTVWRHEEAGKERFFLISGFRRHEAIRNLRTKTPGTFKKVPVSIFEGELKEAYLHNLSENAQRVNPNAVDYGESIIRLIDELGMSQAEVARQMGMSPSWVNVSIRFAKGMEQGVSPQLRGAVQSGLIGFNMGRIASHKDLEVQRKFVQACEAAQKAGEKAPGKDDLEEMDGKPKEKKPPKQKSRDLDQILLRLEEYKSADITGLKTSMAEFSKFLKDHPEAVQMAKDVMKLAHRYGEIKVLTWASGKEIDWKAAKPPFEANTGTEDTGKENVEEMDATPKEKKKAKAEKAKAEAKPAGKKGGKKKAKVEAA